MKGVMRCDRWYGRQRVAATGSEHSVSDDALDVDHGDEEKSYDPILQLTW